MFLEIAKHLYYSCLVYELLNRYVKKNTSYLGLARTKSLKFKIITNLQQFTEAIQKLLLRKCQCLYKQLN